MRTPVQTTPRGLQARAIAGTYVVLLAFNCPDAYRKNLLGFSIKRKDHTNEEVVWLRGGKKFFLPGSDAGGDPSSRTFPIQKFHWGDYTTKAGRTYTYTVVAQEGQPGALVAREQIELTVTCEDPLHVGADGHQVHFNRAAAASQAYASRFGNKDPDEIGDAAFVWLSRGLEEALVAYVDAAQPGETLNLFVYEFEKPELLEALKNAKARGVKLRIVYDKIISGGKGPSKKSEPAIKKYGLTSVARGRTGAGINISHNKFAVLSGPDGKAKSVWTGSTNWTDNGVYMQTNVGLAVENPALAQTYLDWHQLVWNKPDLSAAESRAAVEKLTQLPPADQPGSFLVLSPRRSTEAITECAKHVSASKRLVCFTAPFQLHKELQTALAATPSQVFGLLNKDSVVGDALRKAPNTQLASAAALDQESALEVWQKDGLAESLHHSGVFIHTKIILVDPLSDHPIVISGSANFSTNSSEKNDENQLFIFGEKEVADIYLGEFMRMFDHYYFRSYLKRVKKQLATPPPATKKPATKKRAGFLAPDGSWTDDFFSGGPKEAMRLAFF